MAPAGKSTRVKPSEVAAETKRNFLPTVRAYYGQVYSPYSQLYRQPTRDLPYRRVHDLRAPTFRFEVGDPVMRAIQYGQMELQAADSRGDDAVRVPFICAANERRPGGDWETGCSGYEEKLCRRSNLSVTLSNPYPHSQTSSSNYPIPSEGGIHSESVVVYRGPHDNYELLPNWYDLPVVSVPPTRWPKLKDHGSKYSFSEEKEMMRQKIRGALSICMHNGYSRVVIGDFGLGNGYRNPPQELAEIWQDVFLYDPLVRGQFEYVVFVFEDEAQSTGRLILEEMVRQDRKRQERSKSSKSSSRSSHDHGSSGSSSSSSSYSTRYLASIPSDMEMFRHVFENPQQPADPRYALQMITG